MSQVVVVTGGAGYIGAPLCLGLAASGRRVRALDSLLHGQADVAAELERAGVELIRGDVRDAAARERALAGADAVVHLAAIVGDPACARDPEAVRRGQRRGHPGARARRARPGVGRFVFASTCSNYGRMADPTTPIDENGVLAPGVALRRAEGGDGEAAARGATAPARADVPALRDDLRRRRRGCGST